MDYIKSIVDKYKIDVNLNHQIVTVFMLTHNREFFLKFAINSVLVQSYKNFQLIVLDNDSTDNTCQVIKEFNDSRIKYILRTSSSKSTNFSFARDICITKYFIMLHDDDILDSCYLDFILSEMEKNDYVALSVSGIMIDEQGNKIGNLTSLNDEKIVWSNGGYLSNFFNKNRINMICPSVIYRSEFYKNFSNFYIFYEIGPAVDQYVWFQTEKLGGTLCFINKSLIKYRVHSNQESGLNGGFMTLQLLSYLISDSYYLSFFNSNRLGLYRELWSAFKTVSKKYYLQIITSEKYFSFWNYEIVRYIKQSVSGKIFFCGLFFLYLNRFVLRKLFFIIKKHI